jgi:hypothetical protein
MAITCVPFFSYVGDLLIPGRACMRREYEYDYPETVRTRYLKAMGFTNAALLGSGVSCTISYIAFRRTAEKTIANKIAKFGICFYGSAMVLAVAISFARFCYAQMNQHR